MILEPKKSTAWRSLIERSEVNILLNLVNDSSMNVRLNILDTLTHLPLPEMEWTQVSKLIRQELQYAKSFKDKSALIGIGTWIPDGFNVENEVRKIETNYKAQNKLLDAVKKIQYQYTIREEYDHEWDASHASGFVLFSDSELLTLKSQLTPKVPNIASKLSNWWNHERPLDFLIEDPVLITLLFELAAKDDNYDVFLINNLLGHLERIENFRPDLNGLFEEYLRCVKGWITERSSYYGVPNGRWFQLYRDDEDSYSWRSWQIAWTVSRGGLKGLISALTIHLTADDETRQMAALALIADSADYIWQRSAAIFGGGIRPPRLAPPNLIEIAQTGVKVEGNYVDVTEEVQFTAYYPPEVKPNHWYVFLAYIHVMDARNTVYEDSQTRLGQQFNDYRKGRGKATEAIVRGTEITIIPELPGCRFNPLRTSVLWLEDWHRIEFRMQASEGLPGFELNTASNGKLLFYVGPILVAEIKLSVYFSDDVELVKEKRSETACTASLYQAVFVSYSHSDTYIVQELEKAYVALGMNYLRDVNILRSGEKWNPALLKKIDEANIFQLCWSKNAKKSTYVEQEWRHALELQRQSFIRPVYWETPMPDSPVELADIHFAYLGTTA
ncbi:toll/interleukin-1 receptor domain-containing protein [candidate division KSB1 bacterium]|nr:toll/interleukin-1 receptor domain-containing protein [candidate division KSB1 bacterium]